MIIKIPVAFPDDFYPPKKFDGVEMNDMTGFCQGCPFYFHDTYEDYEDCTYGLEEDDGCAIRKYFPKII